LVEVYKMNIEQIMQFAVLTIKGRSSGHCEFPSWHRTRLVEHY